MKSLTWLSSFFVWPLTTGQTLFRVLLISYHLREISHISIKILIKLIKYFVLINGYLREIIKIYFTTDANIHSWLRFYDRRTESDYTNKNIKMENISWSSKNQIVKANFDKNYFSWRFEVTFKFMKYLLVIICSRKCKPKSFSCGLDMVVNSIIMFHKPTYSCDVVMSKIHLGAAK